ncbi:hypothetical protein JG687_00000366 [Phytophthora cactorum]|uniref:Uncharacterized protein n=1 Tax=Phytophthora cactorum TaxID=29920 RepID=A0A329SVF6_9STRA|nr:hypothetical protein Pcac1_g261 [Phytophthora cactorum]KAG2848841.1 hypothetical protein PC111_g305 [Phytophthora cactorum]KAG2849136.1 hypothetical protein PC112_g454 [Phytophthora cactorum]KAG2869018.1 hypothetical protein PC113_g538 [Phytophthora cactorum]KAG2934954.1 hypothetical protein PC114_g817 [Phytophthora cactorum]
MPVLVRRCSAKLLPANAPTLLSSAAGAREGEPRQTGGTLLRLPCYGNKAEAAAAETLKRGSSALETAGLASKRGLENGCRSLNSLDAGFSASRTGRTALSSRDVVPLPCTMQPSRSLLPQRDWRRTGL